MEARHAAAHGLLPHMSTFRACMDFGLQWMKVRYWDVMMKKMEERGKDNIPREGESGLFVYNAYGTRASLLFLLCKADSLLLERTALLVPLIRGLHCLAVVQPQMRFKQVTVSERLNCIILPL